MLSLFKFRLKEQVGCWECSVGSRLENHPLCGQERQISALICLWRNLSLLLTISSSLNRGVKIAERLPAPLPIFITSTTFYHVHASDFPNIASSWVMELCCPKAQGSHSRKIANVPRCPALPETLCHCLRIISVSCLGHDLDGGGGKGMWTLVAPAWDIVSVLLVHCVLLCLHCMQVIIWLLLAKYLGISEQGGGVVPCQLCKAQAINPFSKHSVTDRDSAAPLAWPPAAWVALRTRSAVCITGATTLLLCQTLQAH